MFKIQFFQRKSVKVLLVGVVILVFIILLLGTKKSSQVFGSSSIRFKVPNIVHFIILKEANVIESSETIDFIGATCILAAFLNQNPEEIVIHTNLEDFKGKYWKLLKDVITDKLETDVINRPTHVFGAPLSSVFHSADIARLQILQAEGGIFLDLDTFVVQSLKGFFDNECSIGWPLGQNIGTQVYKIVPSQQNIHLILTTF
jgi:hypothetical protein